MTRIVLDCDPANDDALAILVAAGDPRIDLLGITTVAGHTSADRTATNAAIAAHVAGVSAPVSQGAFLPLIRDQLLAGIVDLGNGLDGDRSDLHRVQLDPRHSVELLGELFTENPGATLVCTGPLTNVALALRRYPHFASSVGRAVILGGSWGLGNKTPAAEWNVLCDPEAAAIVYGSGMPILTLPIDILGAAVIDADLIGLVEAIGGGVGSFAAELLASLASLHRRAAGPQGVDHPSLLDPIAVLAAADPAIATTALARVDIDTRSILNYGRTTIDFQGRSPLPANADVAVALDGARIRAGFVESLRILAQNEMRTIA
jgi:purine nucleosidase